MKLARSYKRFVQSDTEVIAVGPDGKEAFAAFFGAQRIPFPGIPDPDETVLGSYGQQSAWWRFGRLPAQFLIDRKGIVRYVEYGRNMRDFTSADELIVLIDKMERET